MSRKPPHVPPMRRRRWNTVVDWAEEHQVKAGGRPLNLSEPSKVWVDRVWHAMIDGNVSDGDFARLDSLFDAYLDGLADEEERFKAEGLLVFLADALVTLGDRLGDRLPICPNCKRMKCPCCERHVAT
jgi:hypothetical protein